MSILRVLVAAVLLLGISAGKGMAQTVEDYGAAASASSGGVEPEPEQEVGLYDNLSGADYELAAQDLSMLATTHFNIERFRSRLIELLSGAPDLPTDLAALIASVSPTGSALHFLKVIGLLLVFFLLSYVFEYKVYGSRIVGPWFIRQQVDHPNGIVEKLPILVIRALLGFGAVLISLLVVATVAPVFIDLSDPITQKTVLVVVPLVAIARASIYVWRMVLSPYLPNYRIPSLSDQAARKLFNWLWIIVAASMALIAFTYWLQDIKAAAPIYKLVTLIAGLIIMAINVALIVANRRAISQAFLGDRTWDSATWVARSGAVIWAPLALTYVISSWAYQSYQLVLGVAIGQPPILGAYVILLAVIVAYGVVAFAIARLFSHRRRLVEARALARAADRAEDRSALDLDPSLTIEQTLEGDPQTEDGDEDSGPAGRSRLIMERAEVRSRLHGLRDFEDLARRVATIFAVGAGIYALASIWDMAYLFDEGYFLDRVEDIVDILLVGYIAYQAVRIWIDTKIAEEIGDMPEQELGDEGGGAHSVSRLATLLPLFRNTMLFVIGATVLLLILLEAGVNVAPIFAGAGVVGLAIGFGAQALIRDILSGAFFLFDDAFRRGEYIDVGAVKGTVERISVRSFQLRHHLGALHTIPFGEIQHLTNYSRDWVMMKLPLRVTYDTDVEHVRKLVKKLGQELLEHPTEGEKFVQPLKSQGVYKMEDSAMIIRIKFMTRPGDQWTTRKLIYTRIRELFEENGIKFAHREVTVRLGDKRIEDLTPEEEEAVAGAAQQAAALSEEQAQPKAAGGMDR